MIKRGELKIGDEVILNPIAKVGKRYKYGSGSSSLELTGDMLFQGVRKIRFIHSDSVNDVVQLEGKNGRNENYTLEMLLRPTDIKYIKQEG